MAGLGNEGRTGMKTEQEIRAILAQCTGTEKYHRVSLIPGAPVATDGAVALAEAAGCWWLLDAIVSRQGNRRLDPGFQTWTLKRNKRGDGAKLTGGDGDGAKAVGQRIPFTDFPLAEITLYVVGGVILLPSEY